ncbi:MAG: Cys-tRNA(Pro) deacylase [Oscillospiraceae bacterium]|nr:Cys-tRNA(Pro) deacylase [Oscillospiraceae bacterium]
MTKTNALRLLDAAGIHYNIRSYDYDEKNPCGLRPNDQDAALQERMFKTLAARGERVGVVIFVIPVNRELDLKKCAQAIGDKRVEMVPMKELLPLTGYVRGGCSPVGMKKKYPTVFDEEALLYDAIFVSAGQRGLQMEVEPQALIDYVEGRAAAVTKS